jgi:hypothetical protein
LFDEMKIQGWHRIGPFSIFDIMEFKRFEALIEMFPQVQIFSTEGEDLDRVITHFLNQQKNVSTMSEAMQRKIQHALAPFFQQRFISLHDEEAPLVRHLLLEKVVLFADGPLYR